MRATAKAHTNIALIKYWGKRNEELILPTNSNLSITLDGFYTETTVHFKEELDRDVFILNEKLFCSLSTSSYSFFPMKIFPSFRIVIIAIFIDIFRIPF